MREIEPRSILIDKILKAYQLHSEEVAETVELYYDAQKLRLIHANKERTEGPDELVSWFARWLILGESVIAGKLRDWIEQGDSPPESKWAYEQYGIGPVLAAGLAAHIDVTKADSISAVWKFAGQAPGFDKRLKGQKLPYNSRLKVLCWKIGESFVKVSGKEEAVYGQLYAKFKAEEIARNASGHYAAAAREQLSSKKFRDNPTRKLLEAGKLSDAYLHARAKRRAVKIFLSHYWTVGRKARGLAIREPYAIAVLGHDGKL